MTKKWNECLYYENMPQELSLSVDLHKEIFEADG